MFNKCDIWHIWQIEFIWDKSRLANTETQDSGSHSKIDYFYFDIDLSLQPKPLILNFKILINHSNQKKINTNHNLYDHIATLIGREIKTDKYQFNCSAQRSVCFSIF